MIYGNPATQKACALPKPVGSMAKPPEGAVSPDQAGGMGMNSNARQLAQSICLAWLNAAPA